MTGTFTLFEKLPTELRLKIWEFAIPGPRVIYLDLVRCEDNTAHAAVEDEKHDSLSVSESLEEGTTTAENADLDTLEEGIEQSSIGNTTVDDDMSGSEESEEATSASDSESEEENATAFRADCLRRKTFATSHAPARTYFDFDRDTIYIRYDEFMPNCYHYGEFLYKITKVRRGGLMVKKVAVLFDVSDNYNVREGLNESLVAGLLGGAFPRLENFTLVLEAVERHPSDKSPTCFIDPIDYNRTIKGYEEFDEDAEDAEAWLGDVWLDFAEFDLELLDRIILRGQKKGLNLSLLIPAIDLKVAVSSYQAEYLEHLRANAKEFSKSRADAG